MSETILSVDRITKRFPGVVANDAVSVDIRRGEIHCLLRRERGQARPPSPTCSTESYRPDEGTVRYNGELLELNTPRDAIEAGIGMVHQHFELVSPMSVVENVVIGTPARQWLDLSEVRRRLGRFFENYDVEIDPDAEVGRLSVGEQQWVEIFKTLYFGVQVLILDEPTAVLTPQGVRQLFRILRRMRDEGLTIILITHKLKEVMELSDRVTVLRRGAVVGTVDTADIDMRVLARMMVGRDVLFQVDKDRSEPGEPIVEVDGIHLESVTGRGSLKGLSLAVHAGEIVGLAGVSGNGQNAPLRCSGRGRQAVQRGYPDRRRGDQRPVCQPDRAAGCGQRPRRPDRPGPADGFPGQGRTWCWAATVALPSRAGGSSTADPSMPSPPSPIEGFDIRSPPASHTTRTLSGGNLAEDHHG